MRTADPDTYVGIKDRKLARHISSKGVVNTDIDALREYKERKLAMESQKSVKDEINSLNQRMSNIEALLEKLINGIS
jgi:uncharacterized protein YPO0396